MPEAGLRGRMGKRAAHGRLRLDCRHKTRARPLLSAVPVGVTYMPQDCPGRILIVDDEVDIRDILSRLVEKAGFEALTAGNGDDAVMMIRSQTPDALLLDIRMPGTDGMKVLQQAQETDRGLPVIVITAYPGIHGAVEAVRAGAHDYLAKPFDHAEVIGSLRRALALRDCQRRLKDLAVQAPGNCRLRELMGPSKEVANLITAVDRVAESDFSVLIQGATGSGKELIAHAIHAASTRSGMPLCPIDCGAIPEALFESELFGHEKGAFTGAGSQKTGSFEAAEGGTVFLDEIANMPLSAQAKLLRTLQDKTVLRVGSTTPIKVDVRILAASNVNLQGAVSLGAFRRDLFYRLAEFTISVPPLRERREDILYLANRFLQITNLELSKNVTGFSDSAAQALLASDWPGNVRQLRSAVRRAVLLADAVVGEEHLAVGMPSVTEPEPITGDGDTSRLRADRPLKEIVREATIAVERNVLAKVLKQTGGNKAKAARILQIDYKTLLTKMDTSGIPRTRRIAVLPATGGDHENAKGQGPTERRTGTRPRQRHTGRPRRPGAKTE